MTGATMTSVWGKWKGLGFEEEARMTRMKRLIKHLVSGLALVLYVLSPDYAFAVISLDTQFINKTVVFFFATDPAGHRIPDATGFLIMVPSKTGKTGYPFLVTARHVVDPAWTGCAAQNPNRLFIRVNKMRYDPKVDDTGVAYLPLDLTKNGGATWHKSKDDNVDVAVFDAPEALLTGTYDVRFLNVRNFGTPEEMAKLGIGSQVASTGMVPQLLGEKRNYPMWKFGKIAALPEELGPMIQCAPNVPSATGRRLRAWWIATNLVGGNSGSPIYFDPLFPPGGDTSSGEPRAMLIGLQSTALSGADLAGMTPASFILDVISEAAPNDADLTLGLPAK
jgi:hypothetical protein